MLTIVSVACFAFDTVMLLSDTDDPKSKTVLTVVLRAMSDPSLDAEFGPIRKDVESAVLMSPVDVAIPYLHPTFAAIESLPGWQAGLGASFGVMRTKVEKSIYYSVNDPDEAALQQDADNIYAILRSGSMRRAAQEMIRKFAPYFRDPDRPDWDEIENVEQQYQSFPVPCLVMWGRRDETFSIAMGYKLTAQIPNTRLKVVQRAKHSIQQERPCLVASEILRFLGHEEAAAKWAALAEARLAASAAK